LALGDDLAQRFGVLRPIYVAYAVYASDRHEFAYELMRPT
jgi:hypothetical protein